MKQHVQVNAANYSTNCCITEVATSWGKWFGHLKSWATSTRFQDISRYFKVQLSYIPRFNSDSVQLDIQGLPGIQQWGPELHHALRVFDGILPQWQHEIIPQRMCGVTWGYIQCGLANQYLAKELIKGEWFFKSILQILWDLGSRRDIQIFQTSWPRFRGDCSWLQVTLILHCKILDPWKDMRRIATYYAILYIAVEHCSCMLPSTGAKHRAETWAHPSLPRKQWHSWWRWDMFQHLRNRRERQSETVLICFDHFWLTLPKT